MPGVVRTSAEHYPLLRAFLVRFSDMWLRMRYIEEGEALWPINTSNDFRQAVTTLELTERISRGRSRWLHPQSDGG